MNFVGYEEGVDEKGLEFAKRKPEVVTRSMEEFSKPQYGVDVLKVEVPVTMSFVKGTSSYRGESAYSRKEIRTISARPPLSPKSRSSIFPRA